MSLISFHIEIFHVNFSLNVPGKSSIQLSFFLAIAETVLLFKKRKQILFHFPHNKQDEKEGQRPRQGLNTNNMGGLYVSYRFRTR